MSRLLNQETFDLSAADQKWIQENISFKEKENVGVNGIDNGTRKNAVNNRSTLRKHEIINLLRKCTYRTSPKEVASFLDQLFDSPNTKPGHWLYISQTWPPRAINRVIAQMIKRHKTGEETVLNPPGYFTRAIKFRQKRKRRSTNINGTHKRQVNKNPTTGTRIDRGLLKLIKDRASGGGKTTRELLEGYVTEGLANEKG